MALAAPVIITLFLLLLSSSVHSQPPLSTWCNFTNTDKYTANSTFETNLNTLLTNLSTTAPSTSGFFASTSGSAPNRAYGLALCRGDTNSSTCRDCLDNALTNIMQLCPYNKDSIIWYDDCLLRYSNMRFTGSVEDSKRIFMWNTQSISSTNALKFNNSVLDVLNALGTYAVKNATSSGMFAMGNMTIGGLDGHDAVDGLVQCTRDLTPDECNQCLVAIFADLRNCCSNKVGGKVLAASCNFRYEVYPFYNPWPEELFITHVGVAPAAAPVPAELPNPPAAASLSPGATDRTGSINSG